MRVLHRLGNAQQQFGITLRASANAVEVVPHAVAIGIHRHVGGITVHVTAATA